jgi:hypothetical protein
LGRFVGGGRSAWLCGSASSRTCSVFAHPDYRGREWRRDAKLEKAARAAPGPERWAKRIGRCGNRAALLSLRLAASIERLLPPPASARAIIAAEQPDAVAVVGVVFTPGPVDFLKAAAWEGIPTAHWVQSWDNLTNKGLLHFTSDRVFVWNDFQRKELARYHGIPERHACVTGAQTFEHWFNGASPTSRSDFCSLNGLDPAQSIIVYLASSMQVEPPLSVFFMRWLEAVRSSGDPVLEDATVLVRPHPTNLDPWRGLESSHKRLVVSPSIAGAPMNTPEYRQRFRDELHHASATVGLNTSAMIDAAIIGKPVCTVELPDVPDRQRGTIHFEYLVTVGGGFLRSSTSLEEHVGILAQLARADPYARDQRSARFLREFIRPHGPEVSPVAVFTAEMVKLLDAPSEAPMPSKLGLRVGRVIHRAAPVIGAPLEDGLLHRWRWWRRRHKSLRRLMTRLRSWRRARVKEIRWIFLVWLRAAFRARLQRFARHRSAIKDDASSSKQL